MAPFTLQEILAPSGSGHRYVSLIVADCAEQLECRFQILSDLTHRCQVSTSVAVVRCAPDGHDVLLVKMKFISFVNELMRSCDQSEIVHMAEFLGDLVSEQPTCRESIQANPWYLLQRYIPAPLGLTAQVSTSSGSDHTRSQKAPSWGISCARATTRTWSNVLISGLKPPCTQSTLPSMMAPKVIKSNTWQQAFHTDALPYFWKHSS